MPLHDATARRNQSKCHAREDTIANFYIIVIVWELDDLYSVAVLRWSQGRNCAQIFGFAPQFGTMQ